MNSKNILVLGRGAAGLLAALELLKAGHKVTILGKAAVSSEESYVQVIPVKSADLRLEGWSHASIDFFRHLSDDPDSGVKLRTFYKFHGEIVEPWFLGTFEGVRHARPDEILNPVYKDATVLEDFPVIDPAIYLPWLARQVSALGGTFVYGELEHWSDVPNDYDGVVACMGLGGLHLIDDPLLQPELMQIVRLKNDRFKHIQHVFIDDDGPNQLATIIPHASHLALGAVLNGPTDTTLALTNENTLKILDRCSKMLPGFDPRLDEVLKITRIARPKRPAIVHQLENIPTGDGRVLPVFVTRGFHGMTYCAASSVDEIVDTLSAL